MAAGIKGNDEEGRLEVRKKVRLPCRVTWFYYQYSTVG